MTNLNHTKAYQPLQSQTARISHTTKDLLQPHIKGYDHAKIIGRLQENLKRDHSLKASMKRGSRAVIDATQLMPPFADEERLDIKYGLKYHIKELFRHPRAEIKLLTDKLKRKMFAFADAPMPCRGFKTSTKKPRSFAKQDSGRAPRPKTSPKDPTKSPTKEALQFEKSLFQTRKSFSTERSCGMKPVIPTYSNQPPSSIPPFDGLQEELKVFDNLPPEPDSFKNLEKFVEEQQKLSSSSILRQKSSGLRPRRIRSAVFYGTPRKKLFLKIDQIMSYVEQEMSQTESCNKTTQRNRIDALVADLKSELDTLNGKVNQRLLEISRTYINYSSTMMRCSKMMKEQFEDHIIFRQRLMKEFTINGDFKGSPSTRRALMAQLATLESLTFQMYSIHNQIAARRIILCGDLRVLSTIDSRIEEYHKKMALLHPSFKSLRRKSNSIQRPGFRPFNRAILDHCSFCEQFFRLILPLRDRFFKEMEDLYAALIRF
ncbi:uncharacterized protein CXQ87_003488 [Candidozyma duobushaemuli]|uniref:Uncharacterized protein n=1 Tax=Candidozyma duobushaemuli TaxID=1231522 RepID=A0A2V1AD52_9ASCO|nr:uncharacterized protein CXQ87_003488 [[Candida] duobushaemulonis]PVH15642.1 hypothetical protein CXQ87_003488 [[Candida] duobushaemulonis]